MVENIYVFVILVKEYTEMGIICIPKNNTKRRYFHILLQKIEALSPIGCYYNIFSVLVFLYGYMHIYILIMSSEDLSGIYWLKIIFFCSSFVQIRLICSVLYYIKTSNYFHTPAYTITIHI